MNSEKGERIAKVIARAGLCSRRDAEKWIKDGRITLDGQIIYSPAINISPTQKIYVDGKPLPKYGATRLWRYYKPKGLVTTHSDERSRPTIFASLPSELPRVISVGRLDLNSEGLLLLTNDGELSRYLEHPKMGWLRSYRVRVHGQVDPQKLESLKDGVTIDGFNYKKIEVIFDRQQGKNAWLTLGLREGKNREIRKIMEHFGWPVNRLIRISYGPLHLGKLKPGEVEEVNSQTVKKYLVKNL